MKALSALLAALVLLSSLPVMASTATAESTNPTEYAAKTVQGSDFDMTDHSFYGEWVSTGPRSVPWDRVNLTKSYDIYDKTEGSASRVITLNWSNASNCWGTYEFQFNNSIPALRHYTVQFDYKIIMSGNPDQISATVGLRSYTNQTIHLDYMTYGEDLLKTSKWTTWTGNFYDGNHPGRQYDLELGLHMDAGAAQTTGMVELHIDNFRLIAPPTDVRFSYYNAYTGLGLQSELLVPEVWHDGTWSRVWDNEYTVAAGELNAYRVTDYFGQVIAHSPAFYLNDTAVYVDLPVKLVKVHITKPAWYTSDLPPSWYLTYSATGTEIPVEGWDLELIAGFYSFRWDTMLVDKGPDLLDEQDDIVVREGSIGQYIDGNLTTGQSFTVSDFYLSMKPSYRSESGGNMTVIPAGFLTWEGLAKTFGWLVDEVSGNVYYRSIMLAMGIGGAVTFLSTYYNIGRKKAVQKLKEGKI